MKPIDYLLKFDKEFYYPIKQGIKTSTIRKNKKSMNIGDYVVAYFPDLKKGMLLRITEHYAKRLNDLSDKEAETEGYYHEDTLKHTICFIYPDLNDEDYVYYYKFVNKTNQPTCKRVVNDFLKEKGIEVEL